MTFPCYVCLKATDRVVGGVPICFACAAADARDFRLATTRRDATPHETSMILRHGSASGPGAVIATINLPSDWMKQAAKDSRAAVHQSRPATAEEAARFKRERIRFAETDGSLDAIPATPENTAFIKFPAGADAPTVTHTFYMRGDKRISEELFRAAVAAKQCDSRLCGVCQTCRARQTPAR